MVLFFFLGGGGFCSETFLMLVLTGLQKLADRDQD